MDIEYIKSSGMWAAKHLRLSSESVLVLLLAGTGQVLKGRGISKDMRNFLPTRESEKEDIF